MPSDADIPRIQAKNFDCRYHRRHLEIQFPYRTENILHRIDPSSTFRHRIYVQVSHIGVYYICRKMVLPIENLIAWSGK